MNESNSIRPKCRECGGTRERLYESVCQACANAATLAPCKVEARAENDSKSSDRKTDNKARLDRYENRQKIGEWSHGNVYSAYHPGLDRQVVIRVLRLDDPKLVKHKDEFLQRAKAMSLLDDPNTVSTMEAGVDD